MVVFSYYFLKSYYIKSIKQLLGMDYEALNIFIKNKLRKKNITKSAFISQIGMSRPGFDSMFKQKSIRVDVLERIAAVFDVSITDLLNISGDYANTSTGESVVNEPQAIYGKKMYLEQRVELLEQQIKLLLKN